MGRPRPEVWPLTVLCTITIPFYDRKATCTPLVYFLLMKSTPFTYHTVVYNFVNALSLRVAPCKYIQWLVYFKVKLATKIWWQFIFLLSFLYNLNWLVRDLVNKRFFNKFLKLLTQNRLINRQNLALFHELKKRIGTWLWTPRLV